MKIKPKLITQQKIKPEKKEDLLEKFTANHEGWDNFVSEIQENTQTPQEELFQFVKDVNKAVEKQIQRKDAQKSLLKVLKESDDGIWYYHYSPLTIVMEAIYKKIGRKIPAKLEEEKRYLSLPNDSFAVVTPDNKEVIIGEIKDYTVVGMICESERIIRPEIKNKIPVTGEFHSLAYQNGQVIIK